MNAVFEPSLLFIADEDWWDDEKRDAFLEHLLDHLQLIDEYDICQIWWTEQLQTILVGDPNMHPWFGSDQRNPLIVNIHQKFYQRLSYWDENPLPCDITPALSAEYRNLNAQECLLKLVHALLEQEENFHFCVGLANQLKIGEGYAFSCNCHSYQLLPNVINQGSEWLPLLDSVAQFFPASIEDFDTHFPKALELVRRQNYPGKVFLFDFEFSKTFKKSIISRTTLRQEILEAVVKKLVLTTDEARSELVDEYLSKKREWRFRVTWRPTSTRIHYLLEDKKIIFLQYYGEGEHDDGL